jgi:phage shock protein A
VPATLDYSYVQLRGMQRDVQRRLVDVAESRKLLEGQLTRLDAQRTKLHGQASQALGLGREDLARSALERRAALLTEREPIARQHAAISVSETQLSTRVKQLRTQLEQFRTHKETVKATYGAAQARTSALEAMAGLGDHGIETARIVDLAEQKTATMQARAGAIGELLDSGALPDVLGGSDPMTRELDDLTASMSVEQELASMRAALAAPAIPELSAGTGSAAASILDATLGRVHVRA